MRLILRTFSCCLLGLWTLLLLTPQPASAQTCDANTHQSYQADVAAGATSSDLEAKYGSCRTSYTEPSCTGTTTTAFEFMDVKSVQNANIFFERMNGCGYHPQGEMVACDVEIRQLAGYGAFPGGSFEHVRFCLDCDRNGTWDFNTLGFVHVTDNVAAGPVPSWYHLAFATTFGAPAACTANNGGQMNLRAILSYANLPPPCVDAPFAQPLPIFGNIINETLRRDP